MEHFADMGYVAKQLLQKQASNAGHQKERKAKTAVIIKGNPQFVEGADKKQADRLYSNIQKHLERKGYVVTTDRGAPYTSPPKADLWVGHSRGIDRLRFAPRGTKVVGIGGPRGLGEDFPVINHPKDHPSLDKPPVRHHYKFTREMREKLAEAWQRKEGKDPEGGLNAKGVASYRKANPGSKLQTAVTTEPSKLKAGSKDANRRKSFCARMSGMPGPMKDDKGRPTRKALSLRKWNC